MSVATSAIRSFAIFWAIGSVRKIPCSIEVIPASTHAAIPPVAWAWAAMRRPAFFASSIAARISLGVSCGEPGSTPGVITPPVARILMTSAPALSCSRTALLTSSGPSASRPNRQPWPPVMQIPRPAARIRGPAITPARTASRTASAIVSRPPRSRAVVTPASTVCRARSAALIAVMAGASSVSVLTGSASAPRQRWTWQLISPGRRVSPSSCSTAAAAWWRPSGTIALIRPSSTTTARPFTGSAPVP